MKKQKSVLDEMQEQKLLQIEHNGCWLAFWGLLISLFVQIFLYGRDFERIVGEWIVFMCLAVYIVVGCLKNGIWDRRLAPVPEANLKTSLTAGIVSGIVFGLIKYQEYHMAGGAAASGIVIAVLAVVLCFAGLSVLSYFHRERTNRLENAEEAYVEEEIAAEKDVEGKNEKDGKERD